jgi:hypothetical protein
MDLLTALHTKLYTVLTTDATLGTAMGGSVALYLGWAKPDAPMPYVCHLFDSLRANDGEWVSRSGTYIVHIWSAANKTDEAMVIRERIVTLLDQQTWNISSGGTEYVTALRLSLQTEGHIIEDTEDVWHYVCQFNVRLLRRGEINSILAR